MNPYVMVVFECVLALSADVIRYLSGKEQQSFITWG